MGYVSSIQILKIKYEIEYVMRNVDIIKETICFVSLSIKCCTKY